ncbi:hypothetical protein [Flavobacterium flavigenum]|uniref:hypothetical protein n=1 Tax=Flavobacterium flavigenum TaxID=3003258 RepID=UPI002483096E|nr:hypothetical protein [Flavobacterium flavigenum]
MNILTIPYIAGGISHLIPLYVLQQKYLTNITGVKNQFLVNNNSQRFLMMQGVDCVPIDYGFDENLIMSKDLLKINQCVVEMEKKAYEMVKPSLIIEDTACFTPLIAEKNDLPRVSIQRTGIFRYIDKFFRNDKHIHSFHKGSNFVKSVDSSNLYNSELSMFKAADLCFLEKYIKPKAKIIPGISTIERLPDNITDRESYFYSGPLLVMDKPSKDLSARLEDFLNNNKQKPIVFITTGTVDRTPIENFIEFFVKRNYAVITTCNCEINDKYKQEVFYNRLFPLHYICGISNLVIHQCSASIYNYPIMNRVASLTIGTQCYDREDIALRLQELGVSGHIPHPDDNPDYWNVFLEMVDRFEKNTLTDFDMLDKLAAEINETMASFKMEKVIEYALA